MGKRLCLTFSVYYFVHPYNITAIMICQHVFWSFTFFYRKLVTVHSVHSNVAKIHSRLPAAMEFWLVCLGILAYLCQNTSRDSSVWTVTKALCFPYYISNISCIFVIFITTQPLHEIADWQTITYILPFQMFISRCIFFIILCIILHILHSYFG